MSEKKDKKNEDVDDLAFEEIENGADAVKKLREKLKACAKEKNEYLRGWQRTKADFVNQKKEHEADRIRFAKFAKESLIYDILPVLDSFTLAFGQKEAWEKVDGTWRTGVEQICNQLVGVLKENGVTEIPVSAGSVFDPGLHASVGTVETPNKDDDNKVIEVVQKGYLLHDKVLRPASVKVGVAKP